MSGTLGETGPARRPSVAEFAAGRLNVLGHTMPEGGPFLPYTRRERVHRAAHRLRAGRVWLNNYRVWKWLVPFGGYTEPGHGCENGIEVMEHYTQTKSIWVDLQEDAPDWFGD